MESKTSKIFLWVTGGMTILLFVAFATAASWSTVEKWVLKIRISLSSGAELNYLDAHYRFRYREDQYTASQALCHRMYASLELGHPVEEMLDDYALLKKIDPKFYAWNMRLAEIAEKLAERGYRERNSELYDKSIKMFEELLIATAALKTDYPAYLEFQKGLPSKGKALCTFTIFQESCKLARENAGETYAKFLVMTRNVAIRRSPRTMQIAEQLLKETPTPSHVQLLANAFAAHGDFDEALRKLIAAEELHKKLHPHTSPKAKEFDAFLQMVNIDRDLFTSKKLTLSLMH